MADRQFGPRPPVRRSIGTNYSGDGLCARTNASGGIDLYFTTGTGGIAGNSLVTVHDSGNLTTLTSGRGHDQLYRVGELHLEGRGLCARPADL